jgi:hypothetical protein
MEKQMLDFDELNLLVGTPELLELGQRAFLDNLAPNPYF